MSSNVVTQDMYYRVKSYLEEQRADYLDEDIDSALESLEDVKEKCIGDFDYDIITRMVDDETLQKEIDSCRCPKQKGNAFDED